MTRRIAVQVLALSVLFMACLSVLSYLTGWRWMRAWDEPPMAINTALCFLCEGLALLLLARNGGAR